MIGVTVNPFGVNFEQNAPLGNELTLGIIEMSAAAAMFWWWRVATIRCQYAFTNSIGGDISDSFEVAKSQQGVFPPAYVANEKDLVTNATSSIYYIEDPQVPTQMQIGLFRLRVVPKDETLKRWYVTQQFSCSRETSPGTGFTVNGYQFPTGISGGSYSLSAVDPITGVDYTVTGEMYSDPMASGTLSITPASYHSWEDPDGNPLYNTTTGQYA